MMRLRCCALLLACFTSTAVAGPAERLAQAVQFKTISHQDATQVDFGEFERFNTYLQKTYPRVFAELDVEVVNGYSLLLRWPGSDPAAGAILFTAHSDVVPVEPGTEGDWEYPAFDGVVANGKIYGRGTLDDKVGVISLLEAAGRLLAEGFDPRKTIVLAFGHDEEIGGNAGAAQIAARLREQGMQFEWMVDEGGLLIADNPLAPDIPVAMVNVAEKGYLTLTLSATGEGGHSSQPPKVSTIGRLSRALDKIEQNPFPPRLVGPIRAMLEQLAPHASRLNALALSNLWLTESVVAGQMAEDRATNSMVRTTTALTMFNAGVKENVVPQRAEAKVNFRLLPGDTPEQVVAAITAIVDDPEIDISYEQWNRVPPVADYSGGGYAVIAEAVERVYPQAVVTPSLLTATTDTRHYIDLAQNQYRFHGMLLETAQASSVHGTNEFITVDSFDKTVDIATAMMRLGAQ